MKKTSARRTRPARFETQKSAGRAGVSGAPECSADFDPKENRRYGGYAARILAPLAEHYLKMRRLNGVGLFLEVFARLSDALINALYVYTRTKDALGGLETEIVLECGGHPPRRHVARTFPPKAAKDPSSQLDWPTIIDKLGYDPRLTTHDGVATEVRRLRRNARQRARRERNLESEANKKWSVDKAKDLASCNANMASAMSKTSALKSEPTFVYGEIWPPISLLDKINPPIRLVQRPDPEPEDQAQRESRVLGYEGIYYDYNRGRTWAGAPVSERCDHQTRDPP